uniref:EpsG family protein n=1 Tax=Thermodesulfobacterium geofontis TaxID=1295609 RepID=A0A7C4JQA0_9BACT
MNIYIFSYLFLSLVTAIFRKQKLWKLYILFPFVWLLFMIGLRYEIGTDWDAYLKYYEIIYPYWENIFLTDPGYGFINFVAGWLGGEIYLVNTLSGGIFLIGLFYFIKHLPYPSIALAIANAYLTFVAAMGYTRQSVAIGLLMIAYVLFSKGKIIKSFVFSFLAVTFHKTALFGFVIILFTFLCKLRARIIWNKKYFLAFVVIVAMLIMTYSIFFLPYQKYLLTQYILEKMESKGALPRVFLNFIAGLLILLGIVKIKFDKTLWQTISLLSILSFLSMPFLGTTTVDRLNLYMYPIQMVAFTHLINNVKEQNLKYLIWILIFYSYMFILTVWLLFAVHKEFWVPYKNLIFVVTR